MRAQQIADLVYAHRHSVREYDFEKVSLLNGGTWEEALEPLSRMTGSEAWQSSQIGSGSESEGHSGCADHVLPDSAIDVSDPTELPPASCTYGNEIRRNSVVITKLKKRRLRRRRKVKEDPGPDAAPLSPFLGISSPIMSSSTIFAEPAPPSPPLLMLQPTTFSPSANIQGVQRNALLDSTHQLLADDIDRRVSTLRKAREAVLTRLGSQFSKRNDSKENLKALFNRKTGGMGGSNRMEKGTQLVPLMIFR